LNNFSSHDHGAKVAALLARCVSYFVMCLFVLVAESFVLVALSAPPLKVPKKKSSPSPQQACPGCGTVLENRFCGECGLDSQKPEDGGNKEKEVETPEQKEARELREKAIAFRLRKNLQKMNKKK